MALVTPRDGRSGKGDHVGLKIPFFFFGGVVGWWNQVPFSIALRQFYILPDSD